MGRSKHLIIFCLPVVSPVVIVMKPSPLLKLRSYGNGHILIVSFHVLLSMS